MMYDGEQVTNSPFWVNVFDPNQVMIRGLDGGRVGRELTFQGQWLNWEVELFINLTLSQEFEFEFSFLMRFEGEGDIYP